MPRAIDYACLLLKAWFYHAFVVHNSTCVDATSSSRFPTPTPTASPTVTHIELRSVNQFTYTGYEVPVIVPPYSRSIRVFMWGAGGYDGGSGAYVEGVLDVTPGQVLYVLVGQGGCWYCGTAFGGGGYCYYPGGGRSAIRFNSEDLVTAGGGGGGNRGGHATAFANGIPQNISFRGSNDAMSTQCTLNNDGGAGSNVTGGCGYCRDDNVKSIGTGRKYQGGKCPGTTCSGGGGGYYGGGAAYYDVGGGAGSSYLTNLREYDISDGPAPSKGYCAGAYSKHYSRCSGQCGASSQHGCIVIEPLYHVTDEVIQFTYTGSEVALYVPEVYNALRIYMWGAGGYYGGNGAYVEGVLDVAPGQTLSVLVGQGGCQNCGPTFGGGGGGYSGYWGYSGGGRSAIRFQGEDVVTAGGGGGGYLYYNKGGHATAFSNNHILDTSFRGANDEMTTSCGANSDGGGGGNTTGGCSNCGGNGYGSKYKGGSCDYYYYNAGGGGGYYGGGASSYYTNGAGGGSSYLRKLREYNNSDFASMTFGTCAGAYSNQFWRCSGQCGTYNQNGCIVIEGIRAESVAPTEQPTPTPTRVPTSSPSKNPTKAPSRFPSRAPSCSPTLSPTSSPTQPPSVAPSDAPSMRPNLYPTATNAPTYSPSSSPTQAPSASPTTVPSTSSIAPNMQASPTAYPDSSPAPSSQPTSSPSAAAGGTPGQQQNSDISSPLTSHYGLGLLIAVIVLSAIIVLCAACFIGYIVLPRISGSHAGPSKQANANAAASPSHDAAVVISADAGCGKEEKQEEGSRDVECEMTIRKSEYAPDDAAVSSVEISISPRTLEASITALEENVAV